MTNFDEINKMLTDIDLNSKDDHVACVTGLNSWKQYKVGSKEIPQNCFKVNLFDTFFIGFGVVAENISVWLRKNG